jgi:hypothetical protein
MALRASRNERCPCGSGKKYKSCCMPADAAAERMAGVVGEETFRAAENAWQKVAREATVWQADVVPAVVEVRSSPDGMAIVMVTAAGYVVGVDVVQRPGGDGERARVVADAVSRAARVLGAYPQRLQVRDETLADALDGVLDAYDVEVETGALDELDDALTGALENLGGGEGYSRFTLALTWRETGASPEALADLHAAAAEFDDAAPWTILDDDDPLALEFPEGAAWIACVMGSAGMEYGLTLYSSPDDLARVLGGDESPAEVLSAMEGSSLTVSFDARSELTRTMVREVASAGWPLRTKRGYPRLYGMNLPERRITPEHVSIAARALRAVTAHVHDPGVELAAGVRILPFVRTGAEARPSLPEAARPICAEGPGADPEAGLAGWLTDAWDPFVDAGWLTHFEMWLGKQGVAKTPARVDVRTATAWTDYLHLLRLRPGGVTELDLRIFVSDYFYRTGPSKAAMSAFPRTLRRIVAFLEDREGIRYPFAAEIIDEHEALWKRAAEEALEAEEQMEVLGLELAHALITRRLLRPALEGEEEAQDDGPDEWNRLRGELQRRWLHWYDETVRSGVTERDALEDALYERLNDWADTVHPRLNGRTPVEFVKELPPAL